MKIPYAICLASFVVALAQSATADDKKKWLPDATRGQSVSERLCSTCHLVKSGQANSIIAGVPSFVAIANQSDQSGKRISNILMQSHPPMPTMPLTLHEIGDIIAYLETLRDSASGAPLMETSPPPRVKPKYPDQS